jgi:hypothetical protein
MRAGGFVVDKSRRTGRSLQYEPLEAREMMAVVTGALKKGVLKITGTKYADTVNVAQTNGMIHIAGVGTWSAGQVNSITIDLGKGNDTLSLNSLANGGTESLSKYITFSAAKKENDLVHLANGHDVSITGATKHTLIVTQSGTASLNGQLLSWNTPTPPAPTPPTPPAPPSPSTNWFDTHVLDTALRDLGHNLYTDGLIDRNDMISLLRSAEDGSVVDATELTDLRTITSDTALFGSSDYVWKLSSDVVNANTANAKYQGTTLGNLTAGSSSAQMENLVNKWFLGLDRPTAGGTYRQVAGQLFVSGASYTDIHQGNLGDCYFMSSLGEVALKNQAAITNMFIVNGDGTYTVRFFNNGVTNYVTVDSYLPTSSSGSLIYANPGMYYANASNELWAALAEKAYVQMNESGWTRGSLSGTGQNSYSAIEGGYIYAALGHITGQSTTAFNYPTGASSFTTFVTAYNQGKMIGFASKTTPASNQVVGSHAYAVVGYDAVNQTVTLFNPWGIEYGLVTMTWAQIQGSFQYFDRTV